MKRLLRKDQLNEKVSDLGEEGKRVNSSLTVSVCFCYTTKPLKSEGLKATSLAHDPVGQQIQAGFSWAILLFLSGFTHLSAVTCGAGWGLAGPRQSQLGHLVSALVVSHPQKVDSSLFTGPFGRVPRQSKRCIFS